MNSLTLEDFEDHEFLHLVEDAAAEEWATSQEIAALIGLDVPRPARNVGSRLAWLRRYGAVETDGAGRWRLTEAGRALIRGELTAAQERSLEAAATKPLALTRAVSRQFAEQGDEGAAALMHRQWRYGLAQRRRRA